jgi:hypothetical protein
MLMVIVLGYDMSLINAGRQAARIREKKNVLLSRLVFRVGLHEQNGEYPNKEFLDWLESHASSEQVDFVRQIEREALRTTVGAGQSLSAERRQELRAQLDAKPNLIAWLFSSDVTAKELKQYMKHLEVKARHHMPTLFTTANSDVLAYWLCEHASREHYRMLRDIATSIETFRSSRRKSRVAKLWRRIRGVHELVDNVAKNVVGELKADMVGMQSAGQQLVGDVAGRIEHQLHISKLFSDGREESSGMKFASIASDLAEHKVFRLQSKRAIELDELLSNLRYTVNCQSIVLIPAPCGYRDEHYDLVPRRICVDDTNLSYGASAQLLKAIRAKTDWPCSMMDPASPEGMCFSTAQPVNVECLLLDPRFAMVGDRSWLSQICVPVIQGRAAKASKMLGGKEVSSMKRKSGQRSCIALHPRTSVVRSLQNVVGRASFSRKSFQESSGSQSASSWKTRSRHMQKSPGTCKNLQIAQAPLEPGERVVGVLKMINKTSFSGASLGIPFRTSDLAAAQGRALQIVGACLSHFEQIKQVCMSPDDAARLIQYRFRRMRGDSSAGVRRLRKCTSLVGRIRDWKSGHSDRRRRSRSPDVASTSTETARLANSVSSTCVAADGQSATVYSSGAPTPAALPCHYASEREPGPGIQPVVTAADDVPSDVLKPRHRQRHSKRSVASPADAVNSDASRPGHRQRRSKHHREFAELVTTCVAPETTTTSIAQETTAQLPARLLAQEPDKQTFSSFVSLVQVEEREAVPVSPRPSTGAPPNAGHAVAMLQSMPSFSHLCVGAVSQQDTISSTSRVDGLKASTSLEEPSDLEERSFDLGEFGSVDTGTSPGEFSPLVEVTNHTVCVTPNARTPLPLQPAPSGTADRSQLRSQQFRDLMRAEEYSDGGSELGV